MSTLQNVVLPISRLAKRVAWALYGVPVDEAAPCGYCRTPVPAHEGLRERGAVYCTEQCATEDAWAAATA